jgi:hypothetical protein
MSLDMPPAVIGILRVGACYVPMEVIAWSRSRIETTLSELESPVALVTSRVKEPTLEDQFLLRGRSSHFNNR